MRERNLPLERELTRMAAVGAGLVDSGGLDDFADFRALPGGVRRDLDWRREMREELADARNYACWGMVAIWAEYEAGDVQAGEQVAQCLTALSAVVKAWDALA